MQSLIVLSRTSPTPNEFPTLAEREAESETIRRLYLDGVVTQTWLRNDGGACMFADGHDAVSLEQTFSALPPVRLGFLQPPTAIAPKPYSGFGPRTTP